MTLNPTSYPLSARGLASLATILLALLTWPHAATAELKTYAFNGTLDPFFPSVPLEALVPGFDQASGQLVPFSGTMTVDTSLSAPYPGHVLPGPLHMNLFIGGVHLADWSGGTYTSFLDPAPLLVFGMGSLTAGVLPEHPAEFDSGVLLYGIEVDLESSVSHYPTVAPLDGNVSLDDVPELTSLAYDLNKTLAFHMHGLGLIDPYLGQDVSTFQLGTIESFTVVPEPSTVVLAGMAALGFLIVSALRRNALPARKLSVNLNDIRIAGLVMILIFLNGIARAEAASVAFFSNGAYVDVPNEGANLSDSLVNLGHTVNTFTGIAAIDWTNATSANDLLVIPELENGDLYANLDASAKTAIGNYVAGGGGLIVMNQTVGPGDPRTVDLLNGVFGFSLVGDFLSGPTTLNASAAAGTPFASGPASLPNSDATHGLATASLPPGALSLYVAGAVTSVFTVDSGAGRVVYLGFDWWEEPTPGEWEDVLGSAVAFSAVPEPSTWVLWGLGAVGLLAVARRHGRHGRAHQVIALLFCVVLLGWSVTSSAAPITVPSDLNPGDKYRLAFVTSTARDATSTDIADYNTFVTGVANTAPELLALGATWTAIGSTATVEARDNTAT